MAAHNSRGNCSNRRSSANCPTHGAPRGACPECPRCGKCDAAPPLPRRAELSDTASPSGDLELAKLEMEIRKGNAMAQLAEIKILTAQRELVPRMLGEREHAMLAHAVRERFRALAVRVAPELVGQDDRYVIEETLRRHVEEALNVLARAPDLMEVEAAIAAQPLPEPWGSA